MKIWVGVTDENWYDLLSRRPPDEVNFWNQAGGAGLPRSIRASYFYLSYIVRTISSLAAAILFGTLRCRPPWLGMPSARKTAWQPIVT